MRKNILKLAIASTFVFMGIVSFCFSGIVSAEGPTVDFSAITQTTANINLSGFDASKSYTLTVVDISKGTELISYQPKITSRGTAFIYIDSLLLNSSYGVKILSEENVVAYEVFKTEGTPSATITNISPLAGATGDTITITGKNLSGTTQVSFDAANLGATNFTIISDTELKVKVPSGVLTGTITVSTKSFGKITSTQVFTAKSAPLAIAEITNFDPKTGGEKTEVVITGKNLKHVSEVLFNQTKTIPTQTDNSNGLKVVVQVPKGATSGPITLKTEGYGNATTKEIFIVPGSSVAPTLTGSGKTQPTATTQKKVSFSGLVPDCNTGAVNQKTGEYENPCDFDMIITMINHAINYFLTTIATPLFAIIIMYAGWIYISAGGSGKIDLAKKILMNALKGYGIILIAWVVIKTILVALDFKGPMFLG